MSNVETVVKIYEAFGRGDIPFILGNIAEDVAWESWPDNSAQKAGVPWLQAGTGLAAAQNFFGIIGTWQPQKFEVVAVAGSGDTVFGEINVDFILDADHRFTDNEIHLWKFNDAGKIVLFRHYLDTVKAIATLGS